MFKISQLFIYPIKSMGGIALEEAVLTDRGFKHDRQWMLIDANSVFITQRKYPQMALLQVTLEDENLLVTHKISNERVRIPFIPAIKKATQATIWDDIVTVQYVSEEANSWFSAFLGIKCSLVYMPVESERKVSQEYAIHQDQTNLSDGFPLLIIGQSSLDDLNTRLDKPLPINRFRPNIVFTGGAPYQEDLWKKFSISQTRFYGVKPCARCPIPTINQETGSSGKEPLKTLATYRMKNNHIYFGQNLLFEGNGTLRIGDEIIL